MGTEAVRFLVVWMAGWVNSRQLEVSDFLREENRVLRACAARGARRSPGGARPIAICAARTAASLSDSVVAPSASRAARAQRASVGHRAGDSTLIRRAHTRRRMSASGSCVIAHSVSAIAIAAWP